MRNGGPMRTEPPRTRGKSCWHLPLVPLRGQKGHPARHSRVPRETPTPPGPERTASRPQQRARTRDRPRPRGSRDAPPHPLSMHPIPHHPTGGTPVPPPPPRPSLPPRRHNPSRHRAQPTTARTVVLTDGPSDGSDATEHEVEGNPPHPDPLAPSGARSRRTSATRADRRARPPDTRAERERERRRAATSRRIFLTKSAPDPPPSFPISLRVHRDGGECPGSELM